MAGRAKPPPKIRLGASIKDLAHKVADMYEKRHGDTVKSASHSQTSYRSSSRNQVVQPPDAKRSSHSSASTLVPPVGNARNAAFTSPLSESSGSSHFDDFSPPVAQHSFVSISDSEGSRTSLEDNSLEPSPIASSDTPNHMERNLQAFLLRSGLDVRDPQIRQQLLSILENSQHRKEAAGALSHSGIQPAAHSSSPSLASSKGNRQGAAFSPRPRATTTVSRFDSGPSSPSSMRGPRPLPPPPHQNPPASTRDPSDVRLPPSPELLRPTPSLDAFARRSETSSPSNSPYSQSESEAMIRSFARDPTAAVAFLEELLQTVTVPHSAPSSVVDARSVRSEVLPPYRRDEYPTPNNPDSTA